MDQDDEKGDGQFRNSALKDALQGRIKSIIILKMDDEEESDDDDQDLNPASTNKALQSDENP